MADPRTARAFEEALADDPDDLATHMAYADFLVEYGDPRGELIQVQLALEDGSRTAKERKRLQEREKELLDAHEREWLGELAPLLLGTDDERRALFAAEMPDYPDHVGYTTERMHFRHGWARGWLDRFECGSVTVEMVRKVGRSPIARLLRGLVCRGDEQAGIYRYAEGPDLPASKYAHGLRYFRPIEVLATYPAARNVRYFQYGEEVDPEDDSYQSGTQFDQLAPLVGAMPRLEELRILGHIYLPEDCYADLAHLFGLSTLGHLRVLQYYHGTVYPLEALATNPALGRLEQLLCYPHSGAGYSVETNTFHGVITRDHVRALVGTPHLRSLTHLQMRSCSGGDEAVEDILASGVLGRLKILDLRHGRITDRGARLFAGSPEARGLEVLDLINNRLTGDGIAALERAGVRVRAERQLMSPQEDAYLWFGDSE